MTKPKGISSILYIQQVFEVTYDIERRRWRAVVSHVDRKPLIILSIQRTEQFIKEIVLIIRHNNGKSVFNHAYSSDLQQPSNAYKGIADPSEGRMETAAGLDEQTQKECGESSAEALENRGHPHE